jgi:anion-transporting  ArsA/GET3 family ATPase
MEELNTYQGEGVNQAGTPEHIHSMIAKVENPVAVDDAPEQIQQVRPEWLPEKFNDPSELARAYANLERQFHEVNQQVQETQEQAQFQEQVGDIQNTSTSQVHQLLDDRGLDFSVFQKEYNETGELSKDAYDALAEAGIDSKVVDTWIQGQEALVDQNISEIYSMVGGEQQYSQMLEWASDNLQPWEMDAFNEAIDGLDSVAKLAVTGLYARFQNSEGMMPRLMSGDVSLNTAPRYESLAQLTAAMRDPRYHNDPAYRAEVAQRLGNSDIF